MNEQDVLVTGDNRHVYRVSCLAEVDAALADQVRERKLLEIVPIFMLDDADRLLDRRLDLVAAREGTGLGGRVSA